MNISEVFIRRPIATSLLMAGIALFGVVAYRALPVSDLPNQNSRTFSASSIRSLRRGLVSLEEFLELMSGRA